MRYRLAGSGVSVAETAAAVKVEGVLSICCALYWSPELVLYNKTSN